MSVKQTNKLILYGVSLIKYFMQDYHYRGSRTAEPYIFSRHTTQKMPIYLCQGLKLMFLVEYDTPSIALLRDYNIRNTK